MTCWNVFFLWRVPGHICDRSTDNNQPSSSISAATLNKEKIHGKITVTLCLGTPCYLFVHDEGLFHSSSRIFSHLLYLMIFHWSLSDSKSRRVSRTRLRILADLWNSLVWIFSTSPPISNFSSLLTKLVWTVLSTPGIIVINVSFIFHKCF